MPRYFFHIHDGVDMPDDSGTELSGDVEARSQAVVLAGEVLKDLDGAFWTEGSKWSLQVLNESGAEVCELQFSGRKG